MRWGIERAGRLTVRLATPRDPTDLAPRLRPWDIVECLAGGLDPAAILMTPFVDANAHNCWALELEGKLIGMGGLTPIPGTRGATIWFLGSDEVETCGHHFQRLARSWVAYAIGRFEFLANIVPQRCERTICWLERLGFDINPELVHLHGIRFVRFRMDRTDGPTSVTGPP